MPQESAARESQSRRVLCTPYNHAPCHFMQSHIRKVYACLAVTCHLRFWQDDRGLLRATVVTHLLRTHLCREKSHLLLWSCCLCCWPQLFWHIYIYISMFVVTEMLLSNFPHNLCVLLQAEIISTWVRNARTNIPKLTMASTSHLFIVSAWVF